MGTMILAGSKGITLPDPDPSRQFFGNREFTLAWDTCAESKDVVIIYNGDHDHQLNRVMMKKVKFTESKLADY